LLPGDPATAQPLVQQLVQGLLGQGSLAQALAVVHELVPVVRVPVQVRVQVQEQVQVRTRQQQHRQRMTAGLLAGARAAGALAQLQAQERVQPEQGQTASLGLRCCLRRWWNWGPQWAPHS
jgi:hypothetical protein